jgi:Mycothiol maleylpyruvate isomerase N-terminal domain
MTKQDQIKRVREEFVRLTDAIADMDEQALTTPGIGEWGVREVLAHIAGWTRIDAKIMRRLERGERPLPEGEEYGTGDNRNPGFAAEAAARSARNVLDELRVAFLEFMAAAEALPEARLAEGHTAQRIVQDSACEHIKEHRVEIDSYRVTVARSIG